MRHRMTDGAVVETDKATGVWKGTRDAQETVYLSAKGRPYLVRTTKHEDESGESVAQYGASWIGNEQAAAWILANGYDLDGTKFADLAADILE